MKTEEEVKRFLEIIEEKQKLYKPYEIKSKRGLDYSGEILALTWVLDLSPFHEQLSTKAQIKQIIKSHEEGLDFQEVYARLKMIAYNELVTLGEVKEHMRNMLNDGEIYESRPNKFKWLD